MIHLAALMMVASAGASLRPGDLAPPGAEDGCLGAADASVALSIGVKKLAPTAAQLEAADVSGDGQVTVLDVLRILDAAVFNLDLETPPCLAGCSAGQGEPWQSVEKACDGIDNDCDELVDEGCCTPGTSGCKCLADGGCSAGLSCVGAVGQTTCQPCPTGAGCACTTDDQCGGALRCEAGACVACTVGQPGCGCDVHGQCAGCTHCVSARCIDDVSLPGNTNCACGPSASCAGSLDCVDGTCRFCPAGAIGCACGTSGACEAGAVCQAGACVACAGVPCAACTAGSLGCVCGANASCTGALACVGGRCLPTTCQMGELGCPCYGNGSCAPVQGVPLACKSGVCTVPELKVPGSVGTACTGLGQCGSFHGAGLACLSGLCALPGCPFGAKGCPCMASGGCTGAPTYVCDQGVCAKMGCAEGYAGCACTITGQCVPGLDCVAGICGHAGSAYLLVNATNARACDALIVDTETSRITDVTFAPGGDSGCAVHGLFRRRGDRVALSFICAAQTAMVGRQARLTLNNQAATSEDIHVLSFLCYDQLGSPLPSVGMGWE